MTGAACTKNTNNGSMCLTKVCQDLVKPKRAQSITNQFGGALFRKTEFRVHVDAAPPGDDIFPQRKNFSRNSHSMPSFC